MWSILGSPSSGRRGNLGAEDRRAMGLWRNQAKSSVQRLGAGRGENVPAEANVTAGGRGSRPGAGGGVSQGQGQGVAQGSTSGWTPLPFS